MILALLTVGADGLRVVRWALIGIAKKNGKCLAPDTLVTMADGSRRPAREVAAGDEVLSWIGGASTTARVRAVEWQEPNLTVEIRTARGRRLVTTAHHPYRVVGSKLPPSLDRNRGKGRWVDAGRLSVGDRVEVALDWAPDCPQGIGPEVAWVLGAMAGDGSPDGRFSNVDDDVLARLRQSYDLTDCGGTDWYVRGIRPLMREHGLFGCTAATKQVPSAVMGGGRAAASGFLSGLLDTDGHVSGGHQPIVEWYSINRALLDDCQHLLTGLGINACLEPKTGRYLNKPHHSWRLTVRGKAQVARVGMVLDLAHSGKAERLERFAKLATDGWCADSFSTDRVTSVRIIGVNSTIGIEVEDTHVHVTGGLVTHNTELCAALALFFAFGPSGPDGEPEPSALVIIAAGSDDQANTLFSAAATMCRLSPTLSQITEVFESEILCPSLPGSKCQRVAAAAKKTSSNLDGPNIYVVIADELHCWEGAQARVVWNTLTNGGVTRRQPMVLQITTAGYDKDTICGEQYDYGKAVAAGEVVDEGFFFWWVEPPADADHTDPDVIEAANPSFGLVMQIRFYIDQLTKKTPAVFRRYFLNQWTESNETWLPEGAWGAAKVPAFEFDPDAPMMVGTDAATKHDSTAHVIAQIHECAPGCAGWDPELDTPDPDAETKAKVRLRSRIWERPWDPGTRRPLDGWKLPIAEIENELREYHRDYTLASCGYDPALFERSAQQLEAEGLPMEEVPQSDQRMVPAAQTLYQLIVEHRVEHEGAEDFARHMRAAVAVQARGGDGGWRLKKGSSKAKMDAAIAAAIAVLLARQPVEETEPWFAYA